MSSAPPNFPPPPEGYQGPEGPYGPPPGVPGPQPKKKSNLKWWIALATTALVSGSCGVGLGAGTDDSTTTTAAGEPTPTVTVTTTTAAEPGDTVTETVTAEAEPLPAVTETVTEAAAAPPPPPAPSGAFSDGTWIVGSDVPPGRYRTVQAAEEVGSSFCYVDVILNDDYLVQEVTDTGQTIIDIPGSADGALISSSDCGDWALVP